MKDKNYFRLFILSYLFFVLVMFVFARYENKSLKSKILTAIEKQRSDQAQRDNDLLSEYQETLNIMMTQDPRCASKFMEVMEKINTESKNN